MYTTIADKYNPLLNVVIDAAKGHGLTMGTTQKEQARQEGHELGIIKGVASGVAALSNMKRVEKYGKLKTVPITTLYDWLPNVQTWVRMYRELAAPDGTSRQTVFHEWAKKVELMFNAKTFTADLDQMEEERHRSAVLAGDEESTEADKQWLRDEADKYKTLAEQALALMGGNA